MRILAVCTGPLSVSAMLVHHTLGALLPSPLPALILGLSPRVESLAAPVCGRGAQPRCSTQHEQRALSTLTPTTTPYSHSSLGSTAAAANKLPRVFPSWLGRPCDRPSPAASATPTVQPPRICLTISPGHRHPERHPSTNISAIDATTNDSTAPTHTAPCLLQASAAQTSITLRSPSVRHVSRAS